MAPKEPYDDRTLLLIRYLGGELAEPERLDFEKSLSADPGLQGELDVLRSLWDASLSAGKPLDLDLDAEWEAMRGQLPGFGSGEDRGRAVLSGRSSALRLLRLAAVVVFGLVLGISALRLSRALGNEVASAGDLPLELVLDDGTQVTLNRESKLTYKRKAKPGERKVKLKGEAWFDVTPDSTRPFVVDAGEALVEVLGTSFNVSAYEDAGQVEITVATGVVALKGKSDSGESIVMKAGNSGTYAKDTRSLELQTRANPNALSWKTRELYFDGTPLGEVVQILRKVYGADVRLDNPALSACPLTVTFLDQPLADVLNILELTLDLRVEKEGAAWILRGEGCVE
ncbi:MAG: FecR domain-containing protein [Bacteroidales bacterium]